MGSQFHGYLTIRHDCRQACSVLYSYCFEDLHYLLQGDPAVVSTIQVSPITRPSYNFYEETISRGVSNHRGLSYRPLLLGHQGDYGTAGDLYEASPIDLPTQKRLEE